MESFSYIAYDSAGARTQGQMNAVSLDSAKFKLKEQGLTPVKIEPLRSAGGPALPGFLRFSPRPGLSDLEFFTAQLSLLLENGVKIDKALSIAKIGVKNQRLKKIVEDLYQQVRGGTPFALALANYPELFDSLYISVAAIGEATGTMGAVFQDLAGHLKLRQNIASKTKQAMVYPAVIFSVCVLAIVFIFNFLVPRLSVVFEDMENLPVYTELLLVASDLFQRYQFVALPVVLVIIFVLPRLMRQKKTKQAFDAAFVRLPLVRQLIYSLENFKFTTSLAILLRSKVVLSDALDYAVKSIGNAMLRRKLATVRDEVRRGSKLSEAVGRAQFLPEVYVNLIEVGEQTGNLSGVFTEMQDRMRDAYIARVTALVTLIEPLMIVVMGLVVGSVVVVMLLSLTSINDFTF